jgi:hypothetical protein
VRSQNFTDIPDLTMRAVHAKTDRAGSSVGNSQFGKAKAQDYNDIPDITMREIHAKADRAGAGMGNKQLSKNYAFDFVNNIPDLTLREMQIKKFYVNPLRFNQETRSRADANNMDVDIMKEQISQGREPTLSSYNKGPTFDFTILEMHDKPQINRDLYPDVIQDPFMRLGSVGTRVPDILPQDQWHFYSFIDENLRGNPYINNVIHTSPMLPPVPPNAPTLTP